MTTSPNDSNLITKEDFVNTHDNEINQRNVALINKAYKLTRSEYLENKTELSDEDIVRILDLPAERPDFSKIKTYTEKSYEEIKNLPELNELAEKLKAEPEYLKFRSTYIAKSKLLYQESSVLFNEIPALIILDEINDPAYLLPYGYARHEGQEKSFADSLLENNNAFTEFKRVFSDDFSRDFKKGKTQGNEVFILLRDKRFRKTLVFQKLKGIINSSNSKDKTYKVYFYGEHKKELFGYSIDKAGFITELDISQVKKSGLTPLGKPSFAETILNTSTPSTLSNITSDYNFVNNNLFNSMLEKGALIELRRNSKIKNRDERYLISLKNLEAVTNNLSDGILKKSNSQFLQTEKQTQFYKDLQKGEEKTMENVNEERNVALNEEQKNKSILDQGIEQIQANGGMSEAAMEADIDSESLDSFFYDETEDNNDSPSENEIEAAERAYQEWEEMLDDNQKAEEIIEKNHQREPVSLNPEESLDDNQSEKNDNNGQLSKFDSELSEYIEGKLPKNHIFNLGFPGKILQNCGFPKEQRIELSGSHLEFKSKLKRHPFDLGEIKGLDVALQNPLAVFAYGDKTKSQNIIVNIEKEGKNFLTGIHFN